jgi:transketolase
MAENMFDSASKNISKKMRQEFADTMIEIGTKDDKLIVLIGDISHFILQPFAKACPNRFYNIGICEPTIVNMSAGLAKVGFHPVIHTIAPFIVERSLEQIKLDFGYQQLGCNIICVGSAFDYGALGCTHHCYSDFSTLKNIDEMQLIYPGSCKEFNLLFKQTYNNRKPTYFRIPEAQHDENFRDEEIIFGKGIVVKEGKDITIIATGPQLKTALQALDELENSNINAEILYFPTIKPLDEELIIKSLSKTKTCLIVEEHAKYGGLFDDVLRCTSNLDNIKYSSINIGDKFIHKYGSYNDLCYELGFTKDNIIKKINELLSKNEQQ